MWPAQPEMDGSGVKYLLLLNSPFTWIIMALWGTNEPKFINTWFHVELLDHTGSCRACLEVGQHEVKLYLSRATYVRTLNQASLTPVLVGPKLCLLGWEVAPPNSVHAHFWEVPCLNWLKMHCSRVEFVKLCECEIIPTSKYMYMLILSTDTLCINYLCSNE